MLSPFELMYEHPLTLGNIPSSHTPFEDCFPILTHTRNTLRNYANVSLPSPSREILSSPPPIVPGDYVYIKTLTPKPLSPMWTGPYLVFFTTPMVAKFQGVGPWIHFSHLKLIMQVQLSDTSGAGIPTSLLLAPIPEDKKTPSSKPSYTSILPPPATGDLKIKIAWPR